MKMTNAEKSNRRVLFVIGQLMLFPFYLQGREFLELFAKRLVGSIAVCGEIDFVYVAGAFNSVQKAWLAECEQRHSPIRDFVYRLSELCEMRLGSKDYSKFDYYLLALVENYLCKCEGLHPGCDNATTFDVESFIRELSQAFALAPFTGE